MPGFSEILSVGCGFTKSLFRFIKLFSTCRPGCLSEDKLGELPPKTHGDYESAALDLADGGELASAIVAEIALQQKEEEWLAEESKFDASRRVAKKRKTGGALYRQKSWRWILELDNMLKMPPFGVGGLNRFRAPIGWATAEGAACLSWPCLVVSSDQGPDAWTAQSWLESPEHGCLNIVREPDSHNHGLHNDALGAVMDINFGAFLYAATVVLNLHFMPWNNGAFGKKLSQAADSMRRLSGPGHPVFAHWRRASAMWTSPPPMRMGTFGRPSWTQRACGPQARRWACAGGSRCLSRCGACSRIGRACSSC